MKIRKSFCFTWRVQGIPLYKTYMIGSVKRPYIESYKNRRLEYFPIWDLREGDVPVPYLVISLYVKGSFVWDIHDRCSEASVYVL